MRVYDFVGRHNFKWIRKVFFSRVIEVYRTRITGYETHQSQSQMKLNWYLFLNSKRVHDSRSSTSWHTFMNPLISTAGFILFTFQFIVAHSLSAYTHTHSYISLSSHNHNNNHRDVSDKKAFSQMFVIHFSSVHRIGIETKTVWIGTEYIYLCVCARQIEWKHSRNHHHFTVEFVRGTLVCVKSH